MIINCQISGGESGGGAATTNKIIFNKVGYTPTTGDIYLNITDTSVIASTAQNVTTIPSSYDEEDCQYIEKTSSNLTNAYANADSTSYAQISMSTGNGTETWIYYYFDVTNIINDLSDYDLISINYRIKASKSGTSNEVSSCWLQFYNGSDSLGTRHSITNTSTNTFSGSFDGIDWTDLPNLKLKFDGVRGSSNITYARYLRLYGADITINYTTSAEHQTTLKSQVYNGTAWIDAALDNCLDETLQYQPIIE